MQPLQHIFDNVIKTIIADEHKYYLIDIVSYKEYIKYVQIDFLCQ